MKMSVIFTPRFQDALMRLYSQALPGRTAEKIRNNVLLLGLATDSYEKSRLDLLAKHGSKNEDGSPKLDASGNVEIPTENLEAFGKDAALLLEEDFPLQHITMSELYDAYISAADIDALGALISYGK